MTRQQWTVNDLTDAAAEAGRPVTTSYIRRLCRQGIENDGIEAIKIGRDWVISLPEVQRWLTKWLGREWAGR
jgi:hypothetical protein